MRFIAIHFQWGVQVYILYIHLVLGLYLNIYTWSQCECSEDMSGGLKTNGYTIRISIISYIIISCRAGTKVEKQPSKLRRQK